MRRTRNRKHRGSIWPFSSTPATNAPATNAGQEKPGFFASLFGKKNVTPSVAPAPAPSVAPAFAAPSVAPAPANPFSAGPPVAAQGGKRKNKCNWKGGSHFVGAPIGYNQVQATGGQPSEKIMQYATTAGGRRKNRSRRTRRTHCNKSRRNKSRRNRKN